MKRSGLVITFPTGVLYGRALGELRKAIKPYIGVQMHRRRDGVLIVGPPEKLASVMLILPPGYTTAEWRRAPDV